MLHSASKRLAIRLDNPGRFLQDPERLLRQIRSMERKPMPPFERQLTGLQWIAASAFALAGAAAHAHAIIVSAQPAIGATLAKPDVAVQLRFNSRIDPRRSRLQLIGPGGRTTSLAIAKDRPPDVVAAGAAALESGSYRLRWQVMSVDGHITRGDIPFDVQR
jgi:hypothetical protein